LYKNKKILGIIPARKGSKSVKNKNFLKLGGKELVRYAIDSGNKSKFLDRLIISTDDVSKFKPFKKNCDIPFKRPKKYSGDKATTVSVVMHALNYLKARKEYYDYVVVLQPTNPFRKSSDIDNCIKTIIDNKKMCLIGVVKVKANHPSRMYKIDKKNIMKPLTSKDDGETRRRQDLDKIYIRNGSIYITKISQLLKEKQIITKKPIAYIMNEIKSINIDTYDDYIFAKLKLKDWLRE
tara:strand:+ start:365 stop:1075 length:711 start_codon:yes stop_codon:yes gene_type:complete